MVRILITSFFTVGILFGWYLSAFSAMPCDDDANILCHDVQPDGKLIDSCLVSHVKELSVDCWSYIIEEGVLKSASIVSSEGNRRTLVPEEYRRTFNNLKMILDDFDSRLAKRSKSEKYPVIFGAELLPANCNRGSALLKPEAIKGIILYLDRLKALGVQGVTFPIAYPLYTPDFPGYEGYVAFYKQVAQEIKKRDMKMDIETGMIFAKTSFSDLQVGYKNLTFEKYKAQKKQMVAKIIKDLQPNYLNLGSEPDTEEVLTGLKEFNDSEKYTEYINYMLEGLERGKTKIIAGVGSWGNIEHVKSLAANTTLDCINIHVYPIIKDSLSNIFLVTDIARKYNKGIVLDEAWLYKSYEYIGHNNEAWMELFKRDVFSFWAPLDQQFLASMVKLAQIEHIEYLSPFWTNYFFSYLEYNKSNAGLSNMELHSLNEKDEVRNVLLGRFSSTGDFYRRVIHDNK